MEPPAITGGLLKKNYNRLGPCALMWVDRYFHTHQAKRIRRELKRLKFFSGWLYRGIVRKIGEKADLQAVFSTELSLAQRLLILQRQDKNKRYSLCALFTACYPILIHSNPNHGRPG